MEGNFQTHFKTMFHYLSGKSEEYVEEFSPDVGLSTTRRLRNVCV
jgi:hypothetical protein